MSTIFDKNILPEFDTIKDRDEEIYWTEKPKLIPYLFSGTFAALFTIAFGIVWLLVARSGVKENDTNAYFWLFGLFPLLQGLYIFLKKLLSYPNTAYG